MNTFTKAIACAALLAGNGVYVDAFTNPPRNLSFHTTTLSPAVVGGSSMNMINSNKPSSLHRRGVEKKQENVSPLSSSTSKSNKSSGGGKLFAQKVGEESTPGKESLLPSAFFLASAASLAVLASNIHGSSVLPDTIGTWALFWTTLAVGWDNLIIGLGQPFFADAETDESKYNLLKTLSFPRFTAHAVLVPFLYATDAEIGKVMGIDWLQGDLVQTIIVAAAAALAIISRVRFVSSPGIDIADTSESPPEALENSLLWFTYKEPEFLYVVPAILLAIFNLYIGVTGLGSEEFQSAAIYMLVAGGAVLYGNAKPSYVMRFTGNLSEVVMLWLIYGAAEKIML